MENQNAYSPKTLLLLFGLFVVLLWLLFSLGKFIHKTSKIHTEIELIKAQNEKMREELEDGQRYLSYLRTAERIEKEAKVQLGKMRKGESVIILYEEENGVLQEVEEDLSIPLIKKENLSNAQKWQRLLLGGSE